MYRTIYCSFLPPSLLPSLPSFPPFLPPPPALQLTLPPPSTPDSHTTNLSFSRGSSDVSLGVCTNSYYLQSGCTLNVHSSWFRDGMTFELSLTLYSISVSNSVAIRNLTNQTVGYYVCVTDLPYMLGSYRTEDVFINISSMGEGCYCGDYQCLIWQGESL